MSRSYNSLDRVADSSPVCVSIAPDDTGMELNPHLRQQSPLQQDNSLLLPSYAKAQSRDHQAVIVEESHDFKREKEGGVTPIHIMGIPMHKLSRPVQFFVCSLGILFFYLLYGYSQEWIFRVKGFKLFGWYLTLVQFGFYSVFGLLERSLRKESSRKIPFNTYMVIAFLTVATMGLSNSSLGYLNYPTQVIFKSCKLIPVMIGGILIQGKRYSIMNGVAMCLMCIGLVLFNLADVSVQPTMDQTGIIMISLALCADAAIGNIQEKAMKQHSASSVEVVLYSYSIGMVLILILVAVSGSLVPAFLFCLENPKIYMMAAVFSFTGYVGINFVLALVHLFGALLAVTVTTFRKSLTVVLSFLVFTKPFTQQYVWSGLIIFLGIALNIYTKNSDKIDSWMKVILLKLQYSWFGGKKTFNTKQIEV